MTEGLPPPGAAAADMAPTTRWRAHLRFVLKLAVTAGLFWLLFRRVELRELVAAAAGISAASLATALAIQLATLSLGALRWRLLLSAYGADQLPAYGPLLRVYLVGAFYNTYLPGAVGGDVLRGVLTRHAFGSDGTPRSVAVVLVDRVLGLLGLILLSLLATSLFAQRLEHRSLALTTLAVAGCGVLAVILLLGRGPQLAAHLPSVFGRFLRRLPQLTTSLPFVLALSLALIGHALVALCGHVLVAGGAASLPLADSFVAMPLAAAAGFFPLTIAGAGARDLAMVTLYTALGHPRSVALVGSLAFLLTSLLSAGLGGVIQLVAPLAISPRTSEHPPTQ